MAKVMIEIEALNQRWYMLLQQITLYKIAYMQSNFNNSTERR